MKSLMAYRKMSIEELALPRPPIGFSHHGHGDDGDGDGDHALPVVRF